MAVPLLKDVVLAKGETPDFALERELLGSILVTDCLGAVVTELHLRPDHFGVRNHKKIYAAALELEQEGVRPDAILVAARCPVPKDYISDLATEVASPGNALHHARLVIDASKWRTRGTRADELQKAATARDLDSYSSAEAQLGADLEEQTTEFYDTERLGDLVFELAAGEQAKTSFSWGFDKLDRSRKIFPSNLVVISGHSGLGKSLWIDQLLDANQAEHKVCLYINEMSVAERVSRRITRRTGVRPSDLEQGDLNEAERGKVLDVLNQGIGWPMVDAAGWNATEVCADIRRRRWDIAAIDILHQFPYREEADLAAIMSQLANTAKQSGTAIVVACDLNEGRTKLNATGRRPSPKLGDLKGSGSISRRADTVAFVHRNETEEGFVEDEGRVFFAKQRSGQQISVPITFNASRLRLED